MSAEQEEIENWLSKQDVDSFLRSEWDIVTRLHFEADSDWIEIKVSGLDKFDCEVSTRIIKTLPLNDDEAYHLELSKAGTSALAIWKSLKRLKPKPIN
ncbi:MAG: hypothetical protein KGS72_25970 [Cyanobacteria bacterium REEB67]|nr:hypothetical protein [Cyanobacteria bacterium REEB67]